MECAEKEAATLCKPAAFEAARTLIAGSSLDTRLGLPRLEAFPEENRAWTAIDGMRNLPQPQTKV